MMKTDDLEATAMSAYPLRSTSPMPATELPKASLFVKHADDVVHVAKFVFWVILMYAAEGGGTDFSVPVDDKSKM